MTDSMFVRQLYVAYVFDVISRGSPVRCFTRSQAWLERNFFLSYHTVVAIYYYMIQFKNNRHRSRLELGLPLYQGATLSPDSCKTKPFTTGLGNI